MNAQINATYLQQLHTEIKAQASIPDPTYQKLPRSWPARPFDVRILPDFVQNPIDYFDLLWTSEVWDILVKNTNAYAQFKEARNKETKNKTTRWWKPVNLYKMRIFIALLIFIGIKNNSNIKSYWDNTSDLYEPMKYMSFYRFQQIKRYLHVSPVSDLPSCIPISQWYLKLASLFGILCMQFKAYVVIRQNVSFDEMIIPFTGRSRYTIKIKNKPVSEGFKVWVLCCRGYTWDFLFYSRMSCK